MNENNIMFVTEDLKIAVGDAVHFQENSIYNDRVCMKECSGGVQEKTFNKSIEGISEYATPQDIEFYTNLYHQFTKPKCCLPKGHSGRCRSSFSTLFDEDFGNKIKDCDTTPGDDDILFKNRARRTYPVQVTKDQYTKLNAKYKWKGNVLLKAGIPVENGGTNFTIATAHFDFAAVLMLQKGIRHNLPKDIEDSLVVRSKEIVQELAEQKIYIIGKEGYLCDPVLGLTLEPEWYRIDDKRDPNQIQFGHIYPLKPDKYMTRGLNVLPITRRGNLIQSDTPLSEVHSFIKDAAEHTCPR